VTAKSKEGEISVKEDFVSFANKGGKIVETFHTAERTRAPAVVLCHGFTGNRIESHRLFVHAARELCRRSFAVLRFDFQAQAKAGVYPRR